MIALMFISWDKKSEMDSSMFSIVMKRSRLFITPRLSVNWGDSSIQATVSLLKLAIEDS